MPVLMWQQWRSAGFWWFCVITKVYSKRYNKNWTHLLQNTSDYRSLVRGIDFLFWLPRKRNAFDLDPLIISVFHMKLRTIVSLYHHNFKWLTPCSFHRLVVYGGYLIPKGTTLVGNTYTMNLSTNEYQSPDEFIPERYLSSQSMMSASVNATESRDHFMFGWGRQVSFILYSKQHA